jgi:hypothetical protein
MKSMPDYLCFKSIAVAVVFALTNIAAAGTHVEGSVNRCGWFDNPTPQNATLLDRDGVWLISTQGGNSADGDWPEFKPNQWVRTNAGSYGYGCACMKVLTDNKESKITRIISASARSLATCRNDKALKHKEPENPLKKLTK